MDRIARADGQIWLWWTLAPDVIAVARINPGRDWAAYVGACPAYEWAANVERIADSGQKLAPATAAAVFAGRGEIVGLEYRI